MLGMNFHALKLAYLKVQLSNMIGGYFGVHANKPVVCIIRDPSNKKIDPNHKRVFNLASSNGQFYAPLVSKYITIKTEYDELLIEWNQLYRIPVPEYKFPIQQSIGVNKLDYKYFLNAKDHQNPYPCSNDYEFNGDYFRSKNEMFVAIELARLKLEYKVEPAVDFNGEIRYADFIIGVKEANKSAYIEVVGGFGLDGYKERNERKLTLYEESNYRDMRDILKIYLNNGVDTEYIRQQIISLLEILSPNIRDL